MYLSPTNPLFLAQMLGLTALWINFSPGLMAQAPPWWTTRQVVLPGSPPDDYAAVNQGQAKFMAVKAYEELNAKLPGGAGASLDTLHQSLVNSTGSTDNYQSLNAGQLKNLAKPFYDRLIQVGYVTQYPWAGSTNADDYAIVNIGQVKNLFSFDVAKDTDADGLPDWWETKKFGNLTHGGTEDADGDHLSNLAEFQQSSDPTDYYSQGGTPITPVVQITGGNNQQVEKGVIASTPLTIEVHNGVGGAVMPNAPVIFAIADANSTGALGSAPSGAGAPAGLNVQLFTGTSGQSSAYLKASSAAGTMHIEAQAGAGFDTFTITVIEAVSNQPPEVLFETPSSYQRYAAGSAITLQARATDPDGNIQQVAFYRGEQLLGLGQSQGSGLYRFDWTSDEEGASAIIARATDNLGATGFAVRHVRREAAKDDSQALADAGGGIYRPIPDQKQVHVSFPFTLPADFSGAVDRVESNGNVVVKGIPDWTVNQFAGGQFFMLVTKGNKEGAVIELKENDLSSLTPADPAATVGLVPGDRVRIYAFLTLKQAIPAEAVAASPSAQDLRTEVFYYEGQPPEIDRAPSASLHFLNTHWYDSLGVERDHLKLPVFAAFTVRNHAGSGSTKFIPVGDVWLPSVRVPVSTGAAAHDIWLGLPLTTSLSLEESGLLDGSDWLRSTSLVSPGDQLIVLPFESGLDDLTEAKFYLFYHGAWRSLQDGASLDAGNIAALKPGHAVILRKASAAAAAQSQWMVWP